MPAAPKLAVAEKHMEAPSAGPASLAGLPYQRSAPACLSKMKRCFDNSATICGRVARRNRGDTMKTLTFSLAVFAFAALSSRAFAADAVIHNQEVANSPFASSVAVPPGYTTYYI